jgi:hypothetical protein
MPRTPAASADTATPRAAAPAPRRSTGPALNRVDLIGRLTTDPALRFTSSGIAV